MAKQRKQAQARRREQPQERDWSHVGRIGTGVLLFVALCGLMGWGGYRLTDPNVLPIRAVRIEGRFEHVSHAALQEAVAPAVRGGFFTVNVAAVQMAAEALPWVGGASVRRVWPDIVNIVVTEQLPAARWGENGLLNPQGEAFYPPADSLPQGLPWLRGPQDQEAVVWRWYQDMKRALATAGLEIARLDLSDRRAWRLVLTNGIELALGRDDPYHRLLRLVRVYPQVLEPRVAAIKRVDLRYTNGFAVSWKAGEGTAQRPVQEG